MKNTIKIEKAEMYEMFDCITDARIRHQCETVARLREYGKDNVLTKCAWERYKKALTAENIAKRKLFPHIYH